MATIKTMNFDHLVGQDVGTVTLLKEMARGGMAVIFVAYQRTLKRHIAVKILPKSLVTETAAALFQQEAEAAAILSHPNIIPIYEVGETDSFLYFTMQMVAGRSLAEHVMRVRKHVIPSKRFLPVPTAVGIMTQILDALAYAHTQDIVHRDIKPANILIEDHGKRPILTDFGIATSLRGSDIETDTILGTPVYMAPEQLRQGGDIDIRVDVFASGMVLFELLVSALPLPQFKSVHELLKMKLTIGPKLLLKRPSQINSAVPEILDRIVYKSIAQNPDHRYADCRAFLSDLNRIKRVLR